MFSVEIRKLSADEKIDSAEYKNWISGIDDSNLSHKVDDLSDASLNALTKLFPNRNIVIERFSPDVNYGPGRYYKIIKNGAIIGGNLYAEYRVGGITFPINCDGQYELVFEYGATRSEYIFVMKLGQVVSVRNDSAEIIQRILPRSELRTLPELLKMLTKYEYGHMTRPVVTTKQLIIVGGTLLALCKYFGY